MNCEECASTIHQSEYGVMLGVDDHWKAIAPNPEEGLFGSGLLCFSCMDTRLRERVGVTLAESLREDVTLSMYAPATDAMVELLPLSAIDANMDALDGVVEWQWLSERQYDRFAERCETEEWS